VAEPVDGPGAGHPRSKWGFRCRWQKTKHLSRNGCRRGDGITGKKAAVGFNRRSGNRFIAFP